jgi:hypothetical protein
MTCQSRLWHLPSSWVGRCYCGFDLCRWCASCLVGVHGVHGVHGVLTAAQLGGEPYSATLAAEIHSHGYKKAKTLKPSLKTN